MTCQYQDINLGPSISIISNAHVRAHVLGLAFKDDLASSEACSRSRCRARMELIHRSRAGRCHIQVNEVFFD